VVRRLGDIQTQPEGLRWEPQDLRGPKADPWELRPWALTILAFQAVPPGLVGGLARLP